MTDKVCPVCGERFKWYEAECPTDRVALVEHAGPPPAPSAALVSVLRTTQSGLLPLATLALEQNGIEYDVRDAGLAHQIVGYAQAAGSGPVDEPREIVVRAEDAAEARAILEGLRNSVMDTRPIILGQVPSAEPASVEPADAAKPIRLVDTGARRPVGRITEAQLQSLFENLEKESPDDRDYYIDQSTLEMLQDAGADEDLIALLRTAMGNQPGMTVEWSRD
jgi:hypothetical protein